MKLTEKTDSVRFSALAFAEILLSLAGIIGCLLFYRLVPISELAHSIEHSGMDAVKVFAASPICGAVATVIFLICILTNRRYFISLSLSQLNIGGKELTESAAKAACTVSSAIITILLCIATYFSLSFYLFQYDLGFCSPPYNTHFDTYGDFIIAVCIIFSFTAALTFIKMLGVNLPDKAVKGIKAIIVKIKK